MAHYESWGIRQIFRGFLKISVSDSQLNADDGLKIIEVFEIYIYCNSENSPNYSPRIPYLLPFSRLSTDVSTVSEKSLDIHYAAKI